MVGEIRMITSPVDAELGRGNSQVQIQTRSGTNAFRGALVYNNRNSAVEPNTWANNKAQGGAIVPPWTNITEYTGSVGGPIIKNKTFFFFLWDGMLPAARNNVQATVLTPCARNGIFRYFDGWQNGNTQTVKKTTGTTPTIATVNDDGNPMNPANNSDRRASADPALCERVRSSAGELARGQCGLLQPRRTRPTGNQLGSQPHADGSVRLCQ